MDLKEATTKALDITKKLAPYCREIAIAGSIRRKKPHVKDIEIVCIPKEELDHSLFDRDLDLRIQHRDPGFIDTVRELGEIIKGDPIEGKYIQVNTGDINVDIFTATVQSWGLIFAIRTGSAEYAYRVLACGWVRHGYHCRAGTLYWKDREISCYNERDLFMKAGVEYTAPENRFMPEESRG